VEKQKGYRKSKSIDWTTLETEWLASNESLNEFKNRHNLTDDWFYKKVNKLEWVKKKEEIKRKTLLIAEKKLIKSQSDDIWQNQKKLLNATEAQIASIYKATLDEYGHIKKILKPHEINSLSSAIKTVIQSIKLIRGENIGEGPTTNNYHLAIVNLIEQLEYGQTKQLERQDVAHDTSLQDSRQE